MERAAVLLFLAGTLWAQRAGDLLVASRGMKDADFARTLILLVEVNDQSTRGLVLNKPLKVPVTEVLPRWKGSGDPVYGGGPVAIGVNALAKASNCRQVVPGVCVLTERAAIEKRAGPNTRVFLGYTGWSRAQLNDELKRRLWLLQPADAGSIFAPDWERLVRQAEAARGR